MALVLLGAAGLLAVAQATQATVTGTVRGDASGEPLAGAVVSLTDLGRATVTDARGRYELRRVPAGPQHLTIRVMGYGPRTLHALVPAAGELEINITLTPTPVRLAAVAVRPRVSIRGVDVVDSTAFPDRGVTSAAVANHPGLAEPDVLQALSGGYVVLAPESPSGLHIRGGGSDQTAYVLDGIPVFSPYHAAGVFSAWNPDAIDRLQLSTVAPSAAYPDALSGVVEATTRDPGDRLSAQGSLSSTQMRVTVDGPLGGRHAGFVASMRSGFPGPITGSRDPSYMRGETGDWLATLHVDALGGELRALGYGSGNEITTAARSDAAPGVDVRNRFDWYSRSLGIEWRRPIHRGVARLLAWRAKSDDGSLWQPDSSQVELAAGRRDVGMLAVVERGSVHGRSTAGIRVEESRTWYGTTSDSATWEMSTRTPVVTGFVEHSASFGRRVQADIGASLAVAGSHQRLSPRARVEWLATDRLSLTGSYARAHQFSQSLRNSESIVSTIFPADLFVGVGAPGVPVAQSDQAVVSADFRPRAGVRLGLQGYTRRMTGLITEVSRDGDPFATGPFATGGGDARGASVDAAVSTARVGVVASYGVQRVRLDNRLGAYTPEFGATQLLEGGVIVYPTATWSISVGATSAAGRRATTASGGVEWEACNLLDAGCEFTGSPRGSAQSLGDARLPPYVRVDLGVRKHWHVSMGGREVLIAAFGTVTNVFDRRNLMTYATSASSRAPFGVAMRPLAPLVVGLDWHF